MAALTALHSSGVYHLALSPESVRLRRDGVLDGTAPANVGG